MGAYLETVRGAVPPWECDYVEHFTVAYYFDKIHIATACFLNALGFSPLDSNTPRVKDCYVRYMKELRLGDIYTVESGIIDSSGEDLVLGHRFINAATGALCTTVEQTLYGGKSMQAAAGQYRINWDGPAREQRAPVPAEQAWYPGSAGIVQPYEADWRGELGLAGYVHRFSAASAHIMSRFGMTPVYQQERRIGFSTFEFQLRFFAQAKSGDITDVKSTIAHIGRTSLRTVHRMLDPRGGRIIAELSQMGVQLDKDARKPKPFPQDLVAAARAL